MNEVSEFVRQQGSSALRISRRTDEQWHWHEQVHLVLCAQHTWGTLQSRSTPPLYLPNGNL